ncbi:RNA polymerase sigma factor [Bowmanella dokdonensis]|uniref:RNA polymerase sigma factor n=2 Tax=Bowmanella dokdonensis TaxID=751969 RepID=A0A939DL38_9ALTE|nr:RNA polymerase sigma factor [Bowmanella dokdonensis]
MRRYVVSGDSALLTRLYDNCADDLFHYLVSHTDRELAKDISQKAWLRVMDKRHLYRSDGQFRAWLFTLARNLMMDEFRRLQRQPVSEYLETPDTQMDFTDSDIQGRFDQALAALPFLQREAFVLQQEGFGLQDIAAITGEPVETIKSRIRYARKQLRQLLEINHD